MTKQFYFKQFNLASTLLIRLYTVKWFQVLLCITNNSIRTSFVYTQLNCQTVLFLKIQFNVIHWFTQFKSQIVVFDPLIGPYKLLPLWVRVDLGTTAMKEYSTFSKVPGLEPHYQMIYSEHFLSGGGDLTPLQHAVGVFCIPWLLGC